MVAAMSWRVLRAAILAVGCFGLLATAGGCQWWDQLKGPGFSGWEERQGAGFRPKSENAKPSGFFTDRRSEQIESDLGVNQ
jgi:hypothetical protein